MTVGYVEVGYWKYRKAGAGQEYVQSWKGDQVR